MGKQDRKLCPGIETCLTLAARHQAVEILMLVFFITLRIGIVDILLVLTLLACP
jgi:hypothetical protein